MRRVREPLARSLTPTAAVCVAVLVALTAACRPPAETERGGLGQPCYRNGTCDDGLLCDGGLCRPGDPALAGLPRVSILRGPPPLTRQREATLEFACDQDDCVVTCAHDGEVIRPCESPLVLQDLADGPYVVVLQGTGADGRVGPATDHRFTVDGRAPQATIVSGPPVHGQSRDVTFVLACDEGACRFECVLGEGEPAACEATAVYEDLPDGAFRFGARAIDGAGNVGSAAYHDFHVDNRPPVTAFVGGPPEHSASPDAELAFVADEPATFRCRLNAGGWVPCVSPHLLDDLDEGDHLFEVQAMDLAGNIEEEPARHTWTVDLSPPRTRILDGPPDPTPDGDVVLTFEADEPATFECRLDEEVWTPCESPFALEGLPSGRHYVLVRATDLAGNREPEPAVHGFRVEAPWSALAVSADGNLAIRADGTLWAFGELPQLTTPKRIPAPVLTERRWAAVAAGGVTTQPSAPGGRGCAIDTGGELWCWGADDEGQTTGEPGIDVPPTRVAGAGPWRRVGVGGAHTCAIHDDGGLWCWGEVWDATRAPTRIGEDDDWVALAVGADHGCGLRADGGLWCWGRNDSGQLGVGPGIPGTAEPVRVGESSYAVVAAGRRHTCAVQGDGALFCWGSNGYGQLGLGTTGGAVSFPSRVGDASDWATVGFSSSADHACAVRADGGAWCWGRNHEGQLGDGTVESRNAPVAVDTGTRLSAIGGGVAHTCALGDDETIQCWGLGRTGRLGRLDRPVRSLSPAPVDTTSLHGLSTLGRGGAFGGCALREGGEVECWTAGGALQTVTLPTPVRTLGSSGNHACAVTYDGGLWCWGRNADGQLGDGTQDDRDAPVRVGAGRAWASVAAGSVHTCATAMDGSLWCWGYNRGGQVDPFEAMRVLTPHQVGTDTDWTDQIAPTRAETCALKQDGHRWCWGSNEEGQFGDGTNSDAMQPRRILDGGGWTFLHGVSEHVCGLREDRLYCWGENGEGEVGAGFTGGVVWSPREIGSGGWIQAYAGYARTCAIRSDRSLWCWGWALDGAGLGDGSGLPSNRPVRVAGQALWRDTNTFCAMRWDGVLRCWGWGREGRVPSDYLAEW